MSANNLPGMLASAIQGHNSTWSAVQSHTDRRGNVLSWSFTCGGCAQSNYYKTKRHGEDTAYSLARDCVEGHRCPPKKRTAIDGLKRIAEAA